MDNLKQRLIERVDEISADVVQLSHDIHANPELAFAEYKSAALIADLLRKHGFDVEMGVGGVETAFMASRTGKSDTPHIAFMAEYDALPEVGHACGHNIIAACSTGAFIALCGLLEHFEGKVSLIGTPAEESGGGKLKLIDAGVFSGVDFAMMIHPTEGPSLIARGARAARVLSVKFHGKGAHSSIPADGLNALSAAIATFNNINLIRPTFDYRDNCNGIIKQGGVAPNIIPEYAECMFSLRSHTLKKLDALTEQVRLAAECAAKLTGCTVGMQWSQGYAERYPNLPMGGAFKANMEILGEEMAYADPNGLYASSDVGNVTMLMPAIHEYITIAPEGVSAHTAAFAEYAISARGDEVCIKGAKALAMTGYDLLSNPAFRAEARRSYEEQTANL